MSLDKPNRIINERELRIDLDIQRTNFILRKLVNYEFIEIINPYKARNVPKKLKLTKKGISLIELLDKYS